MICGRHLRLLCRLGKLSYVVEEVVVKAFAGRWSLLRVNLEHKLEQVLKRAMLLTPLIADDVI